MGNSEDMVEARLHFASGCVANLTASRVSYESVRSMQVFTDECCAVVDFGARKARLVQPSLEILSRQFEVDTLSQDQKTTLREELFTDLLAKSEVGVTDCNSMEEEQLDFARAIRTSSEPRVSGSDGRNALAVAEMILERVASHQWDGVTGGRSGAFAMPQHESVLETADIWSEEDTVILRRKAG